MNYPKINCKFCSNELSFCRLAPWPADPHGTVMMIDCKKCLSRIPSGLDKLVRSKHAIYFYYETHELNAEELVLDSNIFISTSYGRITYIGQYLFGGPMEVELEEIVVIPAQDINPLDPSLADKIKLWSTFS